MLFFAQLADILEKYESTGSRDNLLTSDLSKLFKQSTPQEGKLLAYLATGRLGCPHSERIPWQGMTAEKLLARMQHTTKIGNSSSQIPTNVQELYNALHQMDTIRPDWYPDKPKSADNLFALVPRLNSLEMKWLLYLMLGKNLFRRNVILESLVKAMKGEDIAEEDDDIQSLLRYMNKSIPDIGIVVAYVLESGLKLAKARLQEIHYGTPIPLEEMDSLNSKLIDRVLKRLRTSAQTTYIQAKSDGIYVQIQKDKENCYIFDELGVDLAQFSPLPENSLVLRADRRFDPRRRQIANRLPELMQLVKSIQSEHIIFDAEIVGVDPIKKSVVNAKQTCQAQDLQLIIFDLLAVHNHDLRKISYNERKSTMANLFGEAHPEYISGVFLAEEVSAVGTIGVTAHMDLFMKQQRYEGVILKNPNMYLTSRINWNVKRVKIKKRTTLDMLLVGFYYNIERTKPTKYLVALKDEKEAYFFPCAITVADKRQTEEINSHCLATASTKCPIDISCEGRPDFWTDATMVVEVESDGLKIKNQDPRFISTKWTLHNNQQRKIIDIRWDKPKNRTNSINRLLLLENAPGN